MENRNFHTSLLGGFRKKDVVSFLAEEKSRQDSALQELQQQITEAEAQLQGLMEERDQALEQVLELRQQLADVREQLADAQTRQDELEDRVNEAALREQAMASQSAQSQAEALQLSEENSRLQARIEELEARPEPCTRWIPPSWTACGSSCRPSSRKPGSWPLCCSGSPRADPVRGKVWISCGRCAARWSAPWARWSVCWTALTA